MIIPPQSRSRRLVGLLVFVAACRTAAPAEAVAPTPLDRQMNAEALLAELNPRGGAALVRAWSGTEPESVAVHYAEDAVLVVDAQTVYRGRSQILEGFLRPLVGNISGLTPTIDKVVGGPDQMTLIGRFTTRVNSPGREPGEANGVFGNTWKKQPDGSWQITAAINDRPKVVVQTTAAPDSTARDSSETAAAIARLSEEWLLAYENGDADAVAALFSDDGIYAANTGQLLRGRDGIREGVRGWIAQQPQLLASLGVTNATGIDVRQEIVRFRLAGDAAYTVTRFMIRVEPSGCFLDAGHGLGVWRLQDGGTWRLESLTVNRDSQAPEGACARR